MFNYKDDIRFNEVIPICNINVMEIKGGGISWLLN